MPTALPLLVQEQVLPNYIELFEFDFVPALGGEFAKFYCTPNTNTFEPIAFLGNDYLPFPIELTGVEQLADGALARPQITVTNLDMFFGTLAFQYGDLVGSTCIYRRTFSTYLAAGLSAPALKMTIGRKIYHTREHLAFEMRHILDQERGYLPKRQMLQTNFPGLGRSKYMG